MTTQDIYETTATGVYEQMPEVVNPSSPRRAAAVGATPGRGRVRRSTAYPERAMSRLDDLRAEYQTILHSMEFAYAMGHSQTYGRDPRLEHVVQRADALRREIAELTAQEQQQG
jgi:hypothetical protein